jgi:transcriptional regulator with XRE-family HTH domain
VVKRYRYISHLAVLIARLNAQRKNKGLEPITVAELARLTGVGRPTVYRWLETDKPLETVNEYTVVAFKEFFGVSDSELITRVDLREGQQQAASTIYA